MIDFLNSKPLYYEKIDYERFPSIYNKVKHHFKLPKIIHIIGTNGKGTTGRFLAVALKNQGFRVGHYTSPHILKFNERIWLDGADISDDILEKAHKKLQLILEKKDSDALSYFEYTTLLAMVVFSECEYVVLEAGLGGEHDATAVFAKTLTLVTPIDFDHQAFLGDDIKAIARTKLKAIQNHAILAKQKHSEVYGVADELDGLDIKKVDSFLDKKESKNIKNIAKTLNLPHYQEQNLTLAISALKFLGLSYDKGSFDGARLFGRFSYVAKNIIVDVGHNPLAAKAIVDELKNLKVILVYNTYKDKNYKQILSILAKNLLYVHVIDVEDGRILPKESLYKALDELGILYKPFDGVLDKELIYLVFGSFSVVQKFLTSEYSIG
ncbi:MAG: bifunctional folylpolyglutamate synthase/dihydrofolate synthase [Sulfurimonadaceae bacterium]|nr:bifunctional folylpolyglutamate synthase/dihydrofolate synthase [Sulfurimonadaceae bacterium]